MTPSANHPRTVAPPNRRDFAARIFWSTHPICQMCAIAYADAGEFTIKQLFAFTECLPTEMFLRLSSIEPHAAQSGIK